MAQKWTYLFIGLIAVLLFGGVYFFSKGSSNSTPIANPTGYEYFWGDGCPHCANVAAFMETWGGRDKIKIDKKEVYKNPVNAKLMTARYQKCNVPRSQMGVPLLVTPEGSCLSGDEPIINHFKSINLGEASESAQSK
jgi:hypothetical protein